MTEKTPVFECQRCGGCCLEFFELTAYPDDIERWMSKDREDILQYADGIFHSIVEGADLWIHPETGEELYRCPFLRKVRNKPMYRCRIHNTRPGQCRSFPHLQYKDGELVAAHTWAVENCPGVEALLKDWSPERVQALRNGKMMIKAIAGEQISDMDSLLRQETDIIGEVSCRDPGRSQG